MPTSLPERRLSAPKGGGSRERGRRFGRGAGRRYQPTLFVRFHSFDDPAAQRQFFAVMAAQQPQVVDYPLGERAKQSADRYHDEQRPERVPNPAAGGDMGIARNPGIVDDQPARSASPLLLPCRPAAPQSTQAAEREPLHRVVADGAHPAALPPLASRPSGRRGRGRKGDITGEEKGTSLGKKRGHHWGRKGDITDIDEAKRIRDNCPLCRGPPGPSKRG